MLKENLTFKEPSKRLELSLWALLPFAYVLLCYQLFPSVTLTISDERAYVEQALAILDGEVYTEASLAATFSGYIPKNYPAGTAIFSTLFVSIGGASAIFISGIFAWLISYWIMLWVLLKKRRSFQAAALILLFLPSIVLSRHVMSELPGTILIALVIALIFCQAKVWYIAFTTTLLGFLSLLFREANVVLVLPLVLSWFYSCDAKAKFWAALGVVAGIAIRLGAGFYFYGDPFYVKDPGISFSLLNVGVNLPYYLLGSMILIPGGLIFMALYRGPYYVSLITGAVLYMGLHLLYGYHGQGADSGRLGGLILGLRFLIPTLPLFVVFTAWHRWSKKTSNRALAIIMVLFWLVITGGVYYLDGQASEAQHARFRMYKEEGVDVCRSASLYEYCTMLNLGHRVKME